MFCNNCKKNIVDFSKNKEFKECLVCTCSNEVDKSGYELCIDCYTQRINNQLVIDTCKTINCICQIDISRYYSNYGTRKPFDLCVCCHRETKRNGCVHKLPPTLRVESDPGGNRGSEYYVYILKQVDGNELYIGHTNNLDARLFEHSQAQIYKRKLVYFHLYDDRDKARVEEARLKEHKLMNINYINKLIEESQPIIEKYYKDSF